MLPALAFVPQEDVIKSFETLIETNYFSTNEELLTPLIDYFENLPQTNKSVEGWHNCFSSMLNSSIHPSIWKFITSLQKEDVSID
ncbi:Uncharacterized protein FWK35_00021416, partial [Aphis craccivora]